MPQRKVNEAPTTEEGDSRQSEIGNWHISCQIVIEVAQAQCPKEK